MRTHWSDRVPQVLFFIALVFSALWFCAWVFPLIDSRSQPRLGEAPNVASDCRAACTLEGMDLAGVELTLRDIPDTRCLCAPVDSTSAVGVDL